MKAIINGFRYDTEKADFIGDASGGGSSVRDFSYWEAGLYRTKTAKRYFLAGSGGPMTQWAKTISQNEWSGGEGIRPLSKGDALSWAEQYLDPETVEKWFYDDIQDA